VPSIAPVVRNRVDGCPGALTVHEAADGGLARIRLPAGALSAVQLATLAATALELGDGQLGLTSRGNLEIRGLADGSQFELGERLAAAGLLPSATHERVRNIVASPLSGIDGVGTDVSEHAAALDRELCARPWLAELPGRFFFALDDGRGDVARLGADVTMSAQGSRAVVGPFDIAVGDAVATMLALAEAFLSLRTQQRSRAWRIAELAGGTAAVAAHARRSLGFAVATSVSAASVSAATPARAPDEPVGVQPQPDGRHALITLAPLGRLDQRQAEALASLAGPRGLRVTPWRSVVVPDLADAQIAQTAARQAGLGVDASSPWYRLSACTGSPGCAKSFADVRADARAEAVAVTQGAGRWPGRRVRWSGCERRCGRPKDTEVDVVAASEGYAVSE
jgi:precorrin-3B synthase